IVDKEDRVIAQLAGCPLDEKDWPGVADSASKEATDICEEFGLSSLAGSNRRGAYPSLSAGFSFGPGLTRPHNIATKSARRAAAKGRLLRHPSFVRLAGFASSAYSFAAPLQFRHYDKVLREVQANDSTLARPFLKSVFPAATFNFGPQALTVPHRDSRNVPYGWCSITALGNYNPKLGGHLILWDLKLIIEFPPGATILLPSALVTHSNTAIQEGETRQSFSQWCSGSLVRWHTYGFRTEGELAEGDAALKRELDRVAADRAREALARFSKHSELEVDNQIWCTRS
ncbi:hypothetical protein FA95DRAFT_1502601, partial [Auriscalpium vulgare]